MVRCSSAKPKPAQAQGRKTVVDDKANGQEEDIPISEQKPNEKKHPDDPCQSMFAASLNEHVGEEGNDKDDGQPKKGRARGRAVLEATDGGMSYVMKRIRGKEDVKARMVAGFCSGFMFSVFTNIPRVDAVKAGLFLAVCYGLAHKESTEPPALEDTCYTRAKSMLSNLGLPKYEKHFKKHSLTDNTMPLLKDSDLVMAGLPIGPRLLILDHIERDPDVQKMRRS